VATATSEAAGAHLSNTTNLAQNETLTINAQAVSLTTGMTNTQVVDAINAYQSVTDVVASLDAAGKLVLTAKDFGAGNGFTAISSLVDTTVGSTGLGDVLLDTEAAPALHVAKQALNLQVDVTAPDLSVASYDVAGNVITSASGVTAGLSFSVLADGVDPAITSNAVHGSTLTVNDGSLTFQIGANAGQTASLSILKASSDALGVNVAGNQFANLKAIDVTTASGSQDSLAVIDVAIDGITNLRGTLGAFQQNTLESTANNLRGTLENTVNAESTIRDTDFAAEIANFTKQQVLTQAGVSVLASANQIPQLALSLLG
ncbi:MAG: flagellin, partial [Pirellulales bacterium]